MMFGRPDVRLQIHSQALAVSQNATSDQGLMEDFTSHPPACARFREPGERPIQAHGLCRHPSIEGRNTVNRIRMLAAALVLAPGLALAAAPTLKVSKSVTIHAPAATVWAKVKDFNALNTWHPAVAKDEIVAGTNNHPGAQRKLTLGNGGEVDEKLESFSDAHRRFGYTIVGGVLPVSDYHSTVRVIAAGKDTSKVTWSGTFKRKDTGDHPAADADDKTATTAISGVYQSGLDNLKKMLETK